MNAKTGIIQHLKIMKKFLLTSVILMGIVASAPAQTGKSRIMAKFVVVDNKHAVMNCPVTLYDYLCVTTKKNESNNIN